VLVALSGGGKGWRGGNGTPFGLMGESQAAEDELVPDSGRLKVIFRGQIPWLLAGNLLRRKDWIRIDFNPTSAVPRHHGAGRPPGSRESGRRRGGVRVPPGQVLRREDQPSLVPPVVVRPADGDNSLESRWSATAAAGPRPGVRR
jgi:hypothetical protein